MPLSSDGGGMDLKGVVAFDSVYGNTQRVAEAMAEEIRAQGHEVVVLNLGQVLRPDAEGDFLVVGSPTRMMRMTRRAKKFVKRAGKTFAGKPVAAFDTIMAPPSDPEKREKAKRWTEHGAGPQLRELAEEEGMKTFPEVLRAEVVDVQGPLAPGTLDKSREFVRRFLASL